MIKATALAGFAIFAALNLSALDTRHVPVSDIRSGSSVDAPHLPNDDTTYPISALICGDLNGDSAIDIRDTTLTLQITVELVKPSRSQLVSGDLNVDGEVGISDAIMSLQHLVGIIAGFDECGTDENRFDDRFSVVLHSRTQTANEYFLDTLRLKSFIDFNTNSAQVPVGAEKLYFVQVPIQAATWTGSDIEGINDFTDQQIAGLGFSTRPQIAAMVNAAPSGSTWQIFGEANRYGFMQGDKWAAVFHYFTTQIKANDPTAKIIGTSTLNWEFTCIGCGGYQKGSDWFDEFIATYEKLYAAKPQVDAWAIDTYPIDWTNTPNTAAHANIVIDQLVGMRADLDNIPEYANTPIWITELSIHVAYDGWQIVDGRIQPVGTYHWENMAGYLIGVLDWLDANAEVMFIEKWFVFISWKDVVNVGPSGYMGIILFDGPNVGASLTCLGELYKAKAFADAGVTCDASGNTVPE